MSWDNEEKQEEENTLVNENYKPTFSNTYSPALEGYFKNTVKPNAFVTLFFGDTSCGKTYPAMTFPEPIRIIDTENRAILTKAYNFDNKAIDIFEPVQFKTEFTSDNVDPFDSYSTIEEITRFIIDFANEVKKGNIKQGTLVIDSCTDIWTFVQDWGTYELSKRSNAKGVRADNITGEIGRPDVERKLKVTPRKSVEWYSRGPIVQLNHPIGTDKGDYGKDKGRHMVKKHGQIQAYDIPYWGKALEVIKYYDEN